MTPEVSARMYRCLGHVYLMLMVLAFVQAVLWASVGQWWHLLLPAAILVACVFGRRECDNRSRL